MLIEDEANEEQKLEHLIWAIKGNLRKEYLSLACKQIEELDKLVEEYETSMTSNTDELRHAPKLYPTKGKMKLR